MNERQLISDLLSALEYHTEQTRPIEFSRVAIEAAREYLRKPAQQPAQQQEQVIAWITNGSLYGLRRTNKKTAVIHRKETKVARIPVFIKVDA